MAASNIVATMDVEDIFYCSECSKYKYGKTYRIKLEAFDMSNLRDKVQTRPTNLDYLPKNWSHYIPEGEDDRVYICPKCKGYESSM